MFAERLKRLRKENRITQTEFAKHFNIATGTIGMWETGKREPDFTTIRAIADYFHVTVDYLLGRDDTAHNTPKIDNDIRRIQRAREKMPEKEKQKMMSMIMTCFDEYFSDDDDIGDDIDE